MAYRRIVVGTDGSERAAQAVREAATLAATVRARLLVVTAHAADDDAARITTDAESVARDAGAADVHVLSEAGEAADVLLRVVEDHGADLVVIGSKGMTDASRFLLGAVANTVSHHAPCDVLIVHTHSGTADPAG